MRMDETIDEAPSDAHAETHESPTSGDEMRRPAQPGSFKARASFLFFYFHTRAPKAIQPILPRARLKRLLLA